MRLDFPNLPLVDNVETHSLRTLHKHCYAELLKIFIAFYDGHKMISNTDDHLRNHGFFRACAWEKWPLQGKLRAETQDPNLK
jgi:hypothetical protein